MTDLYGLLIDLNDGLHDEGGTRAQDAAEDLRAAGLAVAWANDYEWYLVSSDHCAVVGGPLAAGVYDGRCHSLYPAENTDRALQHFCRLVNVSHWLHVSHAPGPDRVLTITPRGSAATGPGHGKADREGTA